VKYHISRENGLSPKDFIPFVKKKPSVIMKIDVTELAEIFSVPNLSLVALPHSFIVESLADAESLPLLSNDAMHIFTMRYAALENIASSDPDFDGIKQVKVWKP
jgi:predicted nucleic acid-binding protein